MRPVAICVLALAVGLVSARAGAQPAPSAPPTEQPRAAAPSQAPSTTPQAAADAAVSVVSLDRIKRGLRQAPARPASKELLKLEYYVEVLGVAPPFSLFDMYDMDTGRIPYSAPTYADMRSVLVPAEFRAPVISLNKAARTGARTILDRSAQRARARRAEEERRKAMQAERERQQKLKETVLVAPPK